jgi:hypothetical protein
MPRPTSGSGSSGWPTAARRALQLASGGLTSTSVEAIFATLPSIRCVPLAEQMGFGAQEQRFEAFFDFFLGTLARLVRGRHGRARRTSGPWRSGSSSGHL